MPPRAARAVEGYQVRDRVIWCSKQEPHRGCRDLVDAARLMRASGLSGLSFRDLRVEVRA